MEDDFISRRSYDLCQRHIDYLNNVNPGNNSQALRTSLDRLIKLDKQTGKKQFLDRLRDNIFIIAAGMIFLLFGIISNDLLIIIISFGIGLFFASYGFVTMKVKKL